MKKALKIILIALGALLLISLLAAFMISRGLEEGKNLPLSGIRQVEKADGTYSGSYENGRFSNQVSVTISAGRISEIKVTKDMMIVQEGLTDRLFEEVMKKQDTKVDTISGATVSCKAYLKAVENAVLE